MSEESKRKSQVLLDLWANPWGEGSGDSHLDWCRGGRWYLGPVATEGLTELPRKGVKPWWRCMICTTYRSGIGMWEQVLGLFKVWGGAQRSQTPPRSTSSYVGTMHFQSPLQPWQASGPGKGWTDSHGKVPWWILDWQEPLNVVLEIDAFLRGVLVAPGRRVVVAKGTDSFLGGNYYSLEKCTKRSNLFSLSSWISDLGREPFFLSSSIKWG